MSKGKVIMFSGCHDDQTSADVRSSRGAGGACTMALTKALSVDDDPTFKRILVRMNDTLKEGNYSQRPLLSTNFELDYKTDKLAIPTGSGAQYRALMIGINYVGQKGELQGCQNDVSEMQAYLRSKGLNQDDNYRLLLDDGQHTSPTKENIINGMKWLVEDAQPGTTLFFHYSGHGGSIEDDDGDEHDGRDECMFPLDHKEAGVIRDDEILTDLVDQVPDGARLIAVYDCCHSGTIMDLPYIYSPAGEKPPPAQKVRAEKKDEAEQEPVSASGQEPEEVEPVSPSGQEPASPSGGTPAGGSLPVKHFVTGTGGGVFNAAAAAAAYRPPGQNQLAQPSKSALAQNGVTGTWFDDEQKARVTVNDSLHCCYEDGTTQDIVKNESGKFVLSGTHTLSAARTNREQLVWEGTQTIKWFPVNLSGGGQATLKLDVTKVMTGDTDAQQERKRVFDYKSSMLGCEITVRLCRNAKGAGDEMVEGEQLLGVHFGFAKLESQTDKYITCATHVEIWDVSASKWAHLSRVPARKFEASGSCYGNKEAIPFEKFKQIVGPGTGQSAYGDLQYMASVRVTVSDVCCREFSDGSEEALLKPV